MHLIKGSSLADRRVFLRIAGNRKIRGAGNARVSRSVICRTEIEISKRVHFSIRTRRRTPSVLFLRMQSTRESVLAEFLPDYRPHYVVLAATFANRFVHFLRIIAEMKSESYYVE